MLISEMMNKDNWSNVLKKVHGIFSEMDGTDKKYLITIEEFKSIISLPQKCVSCLWKNTRHQKCTCCKRNVHMKDNYEPNI